ncbi:MAG TPA: bifunctional adenosylcobinamide kinase/adenosylcobinamide-phosphate guanylyltransferase [Nocardioidaceae bacterium]|nr:bifunctional adenosylcobinamide kinase/adenosylcobinamide-phosphate guanylyltransferase [Nocardioidaceae bacterium]
METLVVGSGSADGWPNPFCGCASCATERGSGRLRTHTSLLVDGSLLLDCGPQTPQGVQRAGVDLSDLRHVLITHQHPDHCSPAFLLFRSWITDRPLDVVGPPDVIEQCRMWVAPDSLVNFVSVSAGDRIALAAYDVRVLAARHGACGTSVLYDVSSATGRVLYATDTGPLPTQTVEGVRGAAFDQVFLEETFGDLVGQSPDHLDLVSFPEQVRRLRKVGALTQDTDLIAIHLSHHNPPSPELNRRLSAWGARAVDDGTRLTATLADPPDPGGKTPSSRHILTDPSSRAEGIRRTLVIGGARSGKSLEAQRLLAAEPDVTYAATSYPAGDDSEWTARIRRHQADRPAHWVTVETLDLVRLLGVPNGALLVDCLTLWLTRVIDECGAWGEEVPADREQAVETKMDALVLAWRGSARRVVAVTNEVGQGVVPDTASGRRFRDLMGRLNARIAAETEDVRWCVAGRVVHL